MDRDLVRALRARGVDVLSALEAGMVDRPDPEHLDYATLHGRAIYSFNIRDYHQIHAEYLTQGRSHAGIILSRQQQYSVGEQMRRLLKLIGTCSADEMKDRMELLSSWA